MLCYSMVSKFAYKYLKIYIEISLYRINIYRMQIKCTIIFPKYVRILSRVLFFHLISALDMIIE